MSSIRAGAGNFIFWALGIKKQVGVANSILRPFRENISYLLRNKAHNVEKPSLVRHASETQL